MDEIEHKVKIYGNGIVNKDFTEYLSKKETNRNFNNNSTISSYTLLVSNTVLFKVIFTFNKSDFFLKFSEVKKATKDLNVI